MIENQESIYQYVAKCIISYVETIGFLISLWPDFPLGMLFSTAS